MKKRAFYLAFTLFLLAGLALWLRPDGHTPPASAGPYDSDDGLPAGAFVARVYYQQIADLNQLVGYDVWEYNNLKEHYVLISMDSTIYGEIAAQGWQLAVDHEATQQLHRSAETFYGGYHTVDELYAELDAIHAANPAITELVDYGDTYCKINGGCTTLGGQTQPGYDLRAIHITNPAIPGPKPVFFHMSAIHSREITTPELNMRLIKWLVEGYNVNADATWIVDHHDIWIVPVTNPDGHWLVVLGTLPPYSGEPFWQRKNANRSNGCTVWPPDAFSQYGVDLNRNHSFMWNGGGSSPEPCEQTYRGPSAASEPEVAQLQNLVLSLIPDQRGPGVNDPAPDNTTGLFISTHSAAGLVLYPWGFTDNAAPNEAGLAAIADKFVSYNGYTPCQPPECLYFVNGTSDDWAYGELGVPAYTFEVGTEFMPAYSDVDAVQWPANGPAYQYAARIARTPYMLVRGPDALDLNLVTNSDTVTLTATINDTDNGNQTITSAVYQLDTPYWITGTITNTMTASDGNFNSQVEAATAVIDISSLANGRHIIYVRGRDSQNNWGSVSAIFLYVIDPALAPILQGYVREAGTNMPLAATVSAGGIFNTTTNPATGFYQMQVISGTYDLTATAADHTAQTIENISAQDLQTVNQDFSLSPTCAALNDDVENGTNGWTAESPWAITTESAHSPTHSWTDSPAVGYGDNLDIAITSPLIDLTDYTAVQLNFWQLCDTEAGYDFCHVEVSDNGGSSWQEVAAYHGLHSQWQEITLDVPLLDNQPDVRLRFRFTSDINTVADGWHIDDVQLIGSFYCGGSVAPEASFTTTSPDALGSPTSFTNTSVGTDLALEWNFGDGSPTVTDTNPVHTYTSTGLYTVTLTATNGLGNDQAAATVQIMVGPQASFTSTSPDDLGQPTTFTNTSTGDDLTFEWDFGDGSPTISDSNPIHTYATAGTYTVTLTVTNPTGSNMITGSVTIEGASHWLYLPAVIKN